MAPTALLVGALIMITVKGERNTNGDLAELLEILEERRDSQTTKRPQLVTHRHYRMKCEYELLPEKFVPPQIVTMGNLTLTCTSTQGGKERQRSSLNPVRKLTTPAPCWTSSRRQMPQSPAREAFGRYRTLLDVIARGIFGKDWT
ncbi:uncharacterized protein LOC144178040 [Haemaphysalis longicornis]